MMCERCSRDAEWLVVVRGQEWIERYCWEHLNGTRYVGKEFEVHPVSKRVPA